MTEGEILMKREKIMLKTISDVKAFVNSVAKYDFDVGNYSPA